VMRGERTGWGGVGEVMISGVTHHRNHSRSGETRKIG
jgi:hypothetical protein